MFQRTPVAIIGALATGAALLAVEPALLQGPTFSISDAFVVEGNSGTTTMTFTVRLSEPSPHDEFVRFTTDSDTAFASVSSFSNATAITIPATGSGLAIGAPASVYPVPIVVSGVQLPARNVKVGLAGLSHTFPQDLDILLVGPLGQKVLLLSDIGSSTADAVNATLSFSPLAFDTVGTTYVSGTYLPTNNGTGDLFPAPAPAEPYGASLTTFDNQDPNGTWNVFVVDDLPADTGSIVATVLSIETAAGDYFSAAGELTFSPGTTERTISVTVLGNTTQEPNERLRVNLIDPSVGGPALGDSQGIGHIFNDDAPGLPPTSIVESYNTPVNVILTVPPSGVLGNDNSNGGGALSAALITPTAHGSVNLNPNGSFVYEPNPGYFGADSFTYRALNTFAQGGLTTVTIMVGSPPTGVSDAFSTAFNLPLVVAAPGVLGNDNAHGSGPMTAIVVGGALHGVVTLNMNGGFTYTPASGFQGTDGFFYTAVNVIGISSSTHVALTVGPPPAASNDAFATAFDSPLAVAAPGVLVNDLSNGGGALTAERLSSTSHGTLALSGDGSFTYSPQPGFAGTDSFTYRANTAVALSGSATVTLTVNEPTTLQAPTNLYVSSMVGNTVTFRFTAPALGPDATGFVLEGGINPGEVLASLPTGSDAPIFTVTAPTGSFYVRVHAINAAEKSGPSNEIRIHVNVPVPPSAPDRFAGTVNGNTVSLSWRNTFIGGPPGGLVLDVGGSATAQLPLGAAESMVVNGAPGGTYTLSLRAVNDGGSSPGSAPITVTIPSACPGPPQTPAAFLAYRLGNTVFVVWEPAASGPAAENYVLIVSGSYVGSFATSARSLSGQVGPGSYTVTVAALNACGASAPTPSQTVGVS